MSIPINGYAAGASKAATLLMRFPVYFASYKYDCTLIKMFLLCQKTLQKYFRKMRTSNPWRSQSEQAN